MTTKIHIALVLILQLIVLSTSAQENDDYLVQEYGSKHTILEAELVGGTPMFPIYKFYNILEHDADYYRLPMLIKQESSINHLLPFAYGVIERTTQIGGSPTLEIKNSTGNFIVQEIDPNVIQLVFDTDITTKHMLPFVTYGLGTNFGTPAVSQAAILQIGNIIQLQMYGPGGTVPTASSNYAIHFLGYLPYVP